MGRAPGAMDGPLKKESPQSHKNFDLFSLVYSSKHSQ